MAVYWPDNMKVDPIGAWPGELTRNRQYSPFRAALSETLTVLERELRMLGAKDARLQIAIPVNRFRIDGRPYADARPEHPGIILTCESKHGPLSYPCDTYATWQDNLRAIALALEALRKVDRYGVTKRGEQYRGFLAIEATAMPSTPFTHEPESVTGWLERLLTTAEVVHSSQLPLPLRTLLRRAQAHTHPDHGGDPEQFRLVSLAESYLREAGVL